jgi:hypothetical protein
MFLIPSWVYQESEEEWPDGEVLSLFVFINNYSTKKKKLVKFIN